MSTRGFDSNNTHTCSSSRQEESSTSMSGAGADVDVDVATEINQLGIASQTSPTPMSEIDNQENRGMYEDEEDNGVQVTCFSEVFNDNTLHFQIIRLPKQIYAWIGCNSAKFGRLYAAASTRPNNTVSVTSLLGGASDNTGSGIARRLVLKTGLNVTLACNIPKDSPMLESDAEKKLVQKLIALGYTKPKPEGSSL